MIAKLLLTAAMLTSIGCSTKYNRLIPVYNGSSSSHYERISIAKRNAQKKRQYQKARLARQQQLLLEKERINAEEIAETIIAERKPIIIDSIKPKVATPSKIIETIEYKEKPETASHTKPVIKQSRITKIESTNSPVNHLIALADKSQQDGDYNRANSFLDRALTISPRNPDIWHKKAQVMYSKGSYNQASSMAMRSNTMTSNINLKKTNWDIIYKARKQMGDLAGAEQAKIFSR